MLPQRRKASRDLTIPATPTRDRLAWKSRHTLAASRAPSISLANAVAMTRPRVGRMRRPAHYAVPGPACITGAASTFGVGAAADPLARLCRAECMLAALILARGGAVDFIDADLSD